MITVPWRLRRRVDASRQHPRHWGIVATLLWILLFFLVSAVIENYAAWSVFRRTIFGSPTDDLNPTTAARAATVAITAVFIMAAVKLRRGDSLTRYLALRSVNWRRRLPDLGVAALVALLVGVVRLGVPSTADRLLLAQDLIVPYTVLFVGLGPLAEESLFRGFAMTGFLSSRWGAKLAVPLSAALWTAGHSAPSWTGYGAIFVLGCSLGVLRVRSDSILPPLMIHAANNAGALLVTVLRAA